MSDIQAMLEWQIIPRNGYKKCTKCKVWKKKEEFYSIGCYCKKCNNETCEKWKQNNMSKHKIHMRKKEAKSKGIIVEDIETWYQEQIIKQDGKCAMPDCRLLAEKNRNGRLCVDHDHVTGEPRGLLCNSCNILLGHYEKRKLSMEAYLGGSRGR